MGKYMDLFPRERFERGAVFERDELESATGMRYGTIWFQQEIMRFQEEIWNWSKREHGERWACRTEAGNVRILTYTESLKKVRSLGRKACRARDRSLRVWESIDRDALAKDDQLAYERQGHSLAVGVKSERPQIQAASSTENTSNRVAAVEKAKAARAARTVAK